MAINIIKIENNNTGDIIEISKFKLEKRDGNYTATSEEEIDGASASNIRFTIKEDNSALILGNGKLSEGNKSISELSLIKKTKLDFEGTLEIKSPKQTAGNKVAQINVKIGNLNPKEDWIINMSNKVENKPSSLDVASLIDWIQDKGADATVELPEGKNESNFKGFVVEFEDLYFNITQKDYKIKLQTKKDETLTLLEKFTISNIKFTLTNMDIPKEKQEK